MSVQPAATAPRQKVESAVRFEWRAELVVGALVLAESAILWVVVSLALTKADPPYYAVPPLTAFFLVFGAAFLPRLLDVFEIWNPAFEVVMIVGVIASAVYAIKT